MFRMTPKTNAGMLMGRSADNAGTMLIYFGKTTQGVDYQLVGLERQKVQSARDAGKLTQATTLIWFGTRTCFSQVTSPRSTMELGGTSARFSAIMTMGISYWPVKTKVAHRVKVVAVQLT